MLPRAPEASSATPSLDGEARTLVKDAAYARTEVSQDSVTLVKDGVSSTPPEVDPAPAPLVEPSFEARYEDRVLLGEGGMGEVRLVKDQRIGREIAMKVIRRSAEGSRGDARVRFEREARVQGQLEHPSVVPVYDLGIRPDGSAFFTMKRVRGQTLEQVIDALRRGDAEAAAIHTRRKLLGAFSSLCLAVAFAHSRRVLHRDLKPGNIMLGAYGELYILDWGLAKILGADERAIPAPEGEEPIEAPLSQRHRTIAGSMMGTPGYMSPEQIRGEIDALDERTDVFALGAILFEILTLEPLFGKPGDDVTAILAATLRGADARPSQRSRGADVPPELDAVCVRATARAPGDRFPSARALHEAVERFLDGDRDLEQRRAMAARHVTRAEELFAEAERGGGDRAREEALRETSAALALDPGHRGAIGLMVRLLLDAPLDLPPDAKKELETRKFEDLGERRGTWLGYATYLGFPPAALLLGVRSYPLFFVLCALAVLSAGVAYAASRRRIDRRAGLVVFTVGTAFMSAMGAFMGPFILVPGMLATNTIAFVSFGERRDRPFFIGVSLLALLVPVALDVAGVLPTSYRFTDAGMLVAPHVVSFPRLPTLLVLALANLMLLIAPALLLARVRDALARNEERLFAYAWRLRQLLPLEARGAALPASMPPASPEACAAELHARLRLRFASLGRPRA